MRSDLPRADGARDRLGDACPASVAIQPAGITSNQPPYSPQAGWKLLRFGAHAPIGAPCPPRQGLHLGSATPMATAPMAAEAPLAGPPNRAPPALTGAVLAAGAERGLQQRLRAQAPGPCAAM